MCMFCRSLFVLFHFFFWPLSCLFFFDIRILITPVVSSNSSYSIGSFVCVYFSEDHSALYFREAYLTSFINIRCIFVSFCVFLSMCLNKSHAKMSWVIMTRECTVGLRLWSKRLTTRHAIDFTLTWSFCGKDHVILFSLYFLFNIYEWIRLYP
jgi:type IV secretory pathway TraG/TraD family ATPase VirD4